MIRIISDSACDLNQDYIEEHKVDIVPMYVTFDGETYLKDKVEVNTMQFYYQMVEQQAYPKTSLPSVDDFYQMFQTFLNAGDEIICICMTNTLSGSFNSGMTAYQMILEDMPDAKLRVYNSWQNTVSQGLLVREMVHMRDDGLSFEEMVDKMDPLIASGKIFFTVGSLECLKKGGRIGKIILHASSMLSIKPILELKDGVLGLGGMARSRKKAKAAVIEKVIGFFESNRLNKEDYIFTVGIGYDQGEGQEFRKEFEEEMGVTCLENQETFPTQIGAVTACHTGPNALGVGIIAKYETL